MAVKTRIFRIGNSRGVRLPRALLEESGLGEQIELEAQQGQIVIRAAQRPRAGWEEQFRAMAERGDDRLLDEGDLPATRWHGSAWTW